MYVDTPYEAVFTIVAINAEKHSAEISTEIFDAQTQKLCTTGLAVIMNTEQF
jgi:hypothetical protein